MADDQSLDALEQRRRRRIIHLREVGMPDAVSQSWADEAEADTSSLLRKVRELEEGTRPHQGRLPPGHR